MTAVKSAEAAKKWTLATQSLAGCFGCHMSLLDIDERILQLVQLVEFHKSPFDDIKEFTKVCDIGLIEGGCGNSENVKVLQDFRKNCRILISVGQCAISGGLPSMRNGISLQELFEETYHNSPIGTNKLIPNGEELPPLLDRIYPCHEIVKIDGYLPGCPPRADLLWEALTLLIAGKSLNDISSKFVRYD
jgi:NAD-reducing hydrogenase small subunit